MRYKIFNFAGMVVDMKYGTFGRMYDISHTTLKKENNAAVDMYCPGASLDISSLMPDSRMMMIQGRWISACLMQESNNERNAQIFKEYNKAKQQAR